MDSLDTDDQLTIVNRSTEYRISKKLIRKVPYFEKMLSHECLESKEAKVTLDFDEKAVKSVLDWVKRNYTMILIEMDYVIDLCGLADYFGLDVIAKECLKYFEDNFTIEHLPDVILKVTSTSKFLNSGALNAFICRYFLKIKNLYADSIDNSKKTFWLEYPIETIEYICALDLMVYSEYQVFDAIVRWVNFKAYSRKCHLVELLKLIRWCHLSEQDLSKIKENGLFKSSGFEPIFCSPRKVNCECTFNRAKQNCFVMIEFCETGCKWRVKVLDNNLTELADQVFISDDSIPANFFQDEHITDITYEYGKSALRIDWKRKKYRHVSSDLSFNILQRCVIRNKDDDQPLSVDPMLEEPIEQGYLILEAAETFTLISFAGRDLNYYSRPTNEDRERWKLIDFGATLMDNAIYLLSNDLTLYEFKIQNNMLVKTWSHRLCDNEYNFEDTLLTSSPAGDKIMVIDTYTRDYICFDVNTKVSSKGQMVFYSSAGKKDSSRLLTCTPAFLPLKTIRTCLNSKPNSEN
ncbi:uncharacterized protein LOC107370988 [Tetranychus urticae]|uniref:BACK domain-containing protein n=1 Tax=Tetranychus urticae TaxID=32264 RepID=T1JXM5_TETUR|nr:uncharacterized protein LOC107370988 [Tetranychus urticae]